MIVWASSKDAGDRIVYESRECKTQRNRLRRLFKNLMLQTPGFVVK